MMQEMWLCYRTDKSSFIAENKWATPLYYGIDSYCATIYVTFGNL